jgi:predicted CopG family antitoxin
MSERRTISVQEGTYQRLLKEGKFQQSFDSLLNELLSERVVSH